MNETLKQLKFLWETKFQSICAHAKTISDHQMQLKRKEALNHMSTYGYRAMARHGREEHGLQRPP